MKRKVWAVAAAVLLLAAGPAPAGPGGGAEAARAAAEPAVAVPGAGGPAVSLFDADGNHISDSLDAALQGAGSGAAFDVVVRFRAPVDDADYAVMAASTGGFPVRARWSRALHGFAGTLSKAQITGLAQGHPGVARIEPDATVTALLYSATQWTGVQQVRVDLGVDGDGVVAAVLDTGIDAAHSDLQGKVVGWHDAVAGRPAPYDDHGHGTHVAAIAAGTGAAAPEQRGVAPGAALVGIKVLDAQGSGTASGIISGIEWMIANKDALNIRIGNMSLGGSGCSDGGDSLSEAVDRAAASGILMVVAAGNSGPGRCTIGAPAAARGAVTVGAAIDPGERGWAPAPFSSRGPTRDGRPKPDLLAPGYGITAARANSGNGYATFNGTSMAAPFIAGVAALMFDANPALTEARAKEILLAAREDWGAAGLDSEYGWGIALPYSAVAAAAGAVSRYDDGIAHASSTGTLAGTGASHFYQVDVTDPGKPLAATLLMNCWPGCDFDLYLWGPDGARVNAAAGTRRQDTILHAPVAAGAYRLQVSSYGGAGGYQLDVSAR